MSLLFFMLTVAYAVTVLLFITGFLRKSPADYTGQPAVSVVIAARNEERHLPHLLADLQHQTYPNFEVIVVNDRSTDGTLAILEAVSTQFPRLRFLSIEAVPAGISPKKYALTQAIAVASGEIICTTDADCRVGRGWVAGLIKSFHPSVGMVLGFTAVIPPLGQTKPNFINRLQMMDYLAMVTSARGVCQLGNAFGASGRNLAYRKQAFEEVGGFTAVMHRLSGDDVLLLQLIRQRTRWKIRFADDPASFNQTYAEPTLKRLLSQRIRWASNSTPQIHLNPLFFTFLALVALVSNLLFWYPVVSFWLAGYWFDYLRLGAVKLAVDALLCTLGAFHFKQRKTLLIFPVWFILHIPYVVSMGVLGIWGKFSWKETVNWRDYHRRTRRN